MKLKKVMSICLVGAMAATLLAGCGSSDSSDASAEEETEEAAGETEEETAAEEEAVAEEEADVEAEEETAADAGSGVSFEGFPDTITIKGYGISAYTVDGLPDVVEAVNAISVPAINVELEYEDIEMGSYSEQIGLMFAGGESFDFMVISGEFQSMQSSGQLLDISPYVDEYAPETMEMLGSFADPFWVDGGLYALPTYDIYNSDCYIIMRKDILDYLDLTEQAESMSSWSDFEAIMGAVYDAQEELPEELQTTALISSSNSNYGSVIAYNGFDNAADDFSEHTGFDILGDTYNNAIMVTDDGIVRNWYETEDYLATVNRVRDWYQNGWVYKDAASGMETSDMAIIDGVSFCTITHSEIGVESAKKLSTGYDVVCVQCCSQPMQTNDVIQLAYGVPSTTNEPEAAVAFLNLMYTNAEIENLFVYGIEGRDYELNEEGEAVILESHTYQSADFLYPNQFNSYPSEGEGGDFRQVSREYLDQAELSPYFGFSVNTEPIDMATNAIFAVIQQYAPGLNTGTVDASETYDEFIDSMYAAGMQDVLDFYQESLDAWLAEQ